MALPNSKLLLGLATLALANAQSTVRSSTSFSTFFGGSGADNVTAIAVDNSGNAYLAGYTDSPDIPQCRTSTRGGGVDAFVAKLNVSSNLLQYCIYLGGSGDDRAFGIAVDATGNAYITGWTTSSNFPTLGPLQSRTSGGKDAFVAKLNPAGGLIYSTYLGGAASDSGNAIAVDTAGQVTVVGATDSTNFPVLSPYQANRRGQTDVFITRLSAAGNSLVYSTYLGGAGADYGYAIALDSLGNAYITGSTMSTDFPTLNAVQNASGGGQDAFVAKLASTGAQLVYSTYLGGAGGTVGFPETGAGIAIDAAGNAYVTGTTSSSNFPTISPFQPRLAGGTDAFVAKLNAFGSGLVYSTYLGGSSVEYGTSIGANAAGEVLVGGYAASTDFPVLNGVQAVQAGSYDAFVTRFSPAGVLVESTFLGGNASDSVNAIAVDGGNNVFVAGQTMSPNFTLRNAWQSAPGGSLDGFLTKFSPLVSGPPDVHIDAPAAGATVSGTVTIAGWAINNTSGIGTALESVTVAVDGVTSGSATYGVSRSDVCGAFPGRVGCPLVGFSYPLNTTTLAAGSHMITVSATSSDTPRRIGTASFGVTVSRAPPDVHIDGPASGSSLSGPTTIAGWVLDNTSVVGTAISSVIVKVDGITLGNATYGHSRPDVCSAYPARPGCPNVGFSYVLNPASLTSGSHSLTVVATNSATPPVSGSSSITFTVATVPTVVIDSPRPGATVSGILTVTGWAIENVYVVGTAISSVGIKVDGVTVGSASYGFRRSDVCAAYPGRLGCPDVGFAYQLDTSALGAGSHTITVSAQNGANPPKVASASVTVTR